ncbi:hypothetical protein [Streptomyces sp. TLI_171]|uniref:hypothetical protein n=1 Tax=Streptomyces sp. TLI_171 TaxID=1938859 RepID=UPI000C19BBD2|nr:hypothetical protein [Streptomyces sp. TLI_171]RKE03006.1 hypothetical protein BX266_7613 [Streptomyces sp. TLI_171]
MSPERRLVSRQEIRAMYGVGANVVAGWIAQAGFPSAQRADAAGAGRGREVERFDQAAVDGWVREHEERVWIGAHEGPAAARQAALSRLPDGNPTDLLDLDDFRTLLGNFNRGRAVARGTMQAYRSRGQIPAADRCEGDGIDPEVYEEMWFRKTVYDYIVDQPGMGARGIGRVTRKDP